MKKYRLIFSTISILFLFSSCKKEELDTRRFYTGNFSFVTVSFVRSMCYDSSVLCIDGWKNSTFDTSSFLSTVERYQQNQLKIYFGDGILGTYNDSTYKQIVFPQLLQDGELAFHDFPSGAYNFIEGNFFGYDSLYLKIQFGTLIGGYSIFEVFGTRND